jgi:hypothetical protein
MRKLGEILVHEGLVAAQHVDRALLWQRDDGGRIGSLLIRLGYLAEREFLRLMAAQLRTRPVLIGEASLDPFLIGLIPTDAARQANAVPIAFHAEHLIVATSDPHNIRALREIEAATGHPVEAWLATDSAVAQVLDRYYPRTVRADTTALVPVRRRETRVTEVDPRASVEPLIHAWIVEALSIGARTVVLQMTSDGLKVRAEAPEGGSVIAEPHASLYRELIRKLRQGAGLRPSSGGARRETGVLPYTQNGARLRLSLTLVPDIYGCSARLDLSEVRAHLDSPRARRGGCDAAYPAERLAS